MTANQASVETDAEAGTMTVITQRPVVVIGVRNGNYVKVEANSLEDVGGGTRNYVYNLANCEELYVVPKGDLDMGGVVNARDLAKNKILFTIC